MFLLTYCSEPAGDNRGEYERKGSVHKVKWGDVILVASGPISNTSRLVSIVDV